MHVPSLDALPTASIRGIALMFFGAPSHNSCLSGKHQVPTLLRVRSGNDAHEWQGLKQAAGSGPSRSPIQRLASIFHLKNCDHVFPDTVLPNSGQALGSTVLATGRKKHISRVRHQTHFFLRRLTVCQLLID